MCFFVCLALPEKDANLKLKTVSHDWELTDATDWPIGKAARGNREHDRAFLITSGGCSCFISDVKKHRAEKSVAAELEILVESLLEHVPSLSMLIHYAQGDISREIVVQKERKLVSFNELRGQLGRLKSDVRYVIKSNHSY
jgi:hypothetical protein